MATPKSFLDTMADNGVTVPEELLPFFTQLNTYLIAAAIQYPIASTTPTINGQLVVEKTSNTVLTFKLKGSDGTVRTATMTLAP